MHVKGLIVPKTCPKGGFPFKVTIGFLDGSSEHRHLHRPLPSGQVGGRDDLRSTASSNGSRRTHDRHPWRSAGCAALPSFRVRSPYCGWRPYCGSQPSPRPSVPHGRGHRAASGVSASSPPSLNPLPPLAPEPTSATIAPSLAPDRLGARASLTFTIHYSGGEFGVPAAVRRSVLRLPAGMSLEVPSLHSCNPARLRARGSERLLGAIADRRRSRARGGACGLADDHRGCRAVGIPRPAREPAADVRGPRAGSHPAGRAGRAQRDGADRRRPLRGNARNVAAACAHAADGVRRVDRHILADGRRERPPERQAERGAGALQVPRGRISVRRRVQPMPTAPRAKRRRAFHARRERLLERTGDRGDLGDAATVCSTIGARSGVATRSPADSRRAGVRRVGSRRAAQLGRAPAAADLIQRRARPHGCPNASRAHATARARPGVPAATRFARHSRIGWAPGYERFRYSDRCGERRRRQLDARTGRGSPTLQADRRDPLRRAWHTPAGAHPGDPQAARRDRRSADPLARDPALCAQGFRRFLLATGYRGELIERFVAATEWPGGVSVECEDTGRADADRRADQAARGHAGGRGELLRDLRRRRSRHRPRRAAGISRRSRRDRDDDRRASAPAVRGHRARRRRSRERLSREATLGALDQRRLLLPAPPTRWATWRATACSSASRCSAWPPRASCGRTATTASGSAWTPTRTRSP